MTIGVHIEANAPGYSREVALMCALQMGAKYATIVNDAELCRMMVDNGIVPIYRINRDGLLDDNAHQRGYSARQYVRKAHADVPDPRCLIYVNNEPGRWDLEKLNLWMLEAIDEANKLGRKIVAYNWSYGNPEPEDADILAPSYTALAEGEHFLGVHEGFDIAHPTLASTRPYLIGRFIPVMQRFGMKVIVTEFAASKTAYDGWQTWLLWYQWSALLEEAVKDVYHPLGIAITPFTLFKWQNGFDYVNSEELKNAIFEINRRFPMHSIVPAPQLGGVRATLTQVPKDFINIRSQPNGNDLGDLRVNETFLVFFDEPYGDWFYVIREKDGLSGWVSLQEGKVKFTIISEEQFYKVSTNEYLQLRDLNEQLTQLLDAISNKKS